MIFHVPSAKLDEHVSAVYPFLRLFEQETQHASADSLLEKIANQERQLWAVADGERLTGIVLTEVYETPRGRMLCAWAAAGNGNSLETITHAYDAIERWAREIGCVSVEIRGRKGWKKVLPGFNETGVILEKSLYV